MGAFSHWPIFLLIIVVALLFMRPGKLSGLMGDAAKGVKAFKDGLKDENAEAEKRETKGEALPRTDAEKEDLKR